VVLKSIFNQLADYGRLMRMHNLIGAYLLLWPTLWSLWIAAEGFPDPQILVIFVLGVFGMRSAGCVINDIADRHFDGKVERTRDRPIATGRVSLVEALGLCLLLLFLCLYLVLLTNALTIAYAVVALVTAAMYPFTKRFTSLPQMILGVAFSMPIPMAFAAQTGEVPAIAWLIFTANLIWTMVYDTQYAMVDKDDDLQLGVGSTAILFGDADRLMVGILQIFTLIALATLGVRLDFNDWYFGSLIVASTFFVYQQILIKDRNRDNCFDAFFNNNWVGLTVFIGIVTSYAYSA